MDFFVSALKCQDTELRLTVGGSTAPYGPEIYYQACTDKLQNNHFPAGIEPGTSRLISKCLTTQLL